MTSKKSLLQSVSFSLLLQNPHVRLLPFFIISFCIWCYSFRGFLSDHLALSGDAVAYYEHVKFFLDRLTAGEFPLWDPSREYGVPNEFYLRRIGEFNPFWLLIIVFKAFGMSYNQSYLLFLGLYFGLGAIGFYALSYKLLKDHRMAFLSYLFFLFSSFGTVVFKSFMLLLFVPIVWFFVFLIGFIQRQEGRYLLGLTFSLMIIFVTYIPLYFLSMFFSLVVLLVIFYRDVFRSFFEALKNVFKNERLIVYWCLAGLVISVLPGLLFAKELSKGDLLISTRTAGSSSGRLEVEEQSLVNAGIPVGKVTSGLFGRFDQFQAGRFYIPILIFIFLVLGVWVKIDGLLLVLFLWGLFSYLLGLYEAFPLYPFLYKHVFFFKWFRNFQFFLWVHLLPVVILLAMIQFKYFLEMASGRTKEKGLAFITATHVFFLVVIFMLDRTSWTAYGVLVLSYLAFVLVFSKKISYGFLLFFAAVIIHPLQVYAYMNKNAPIKKDTYSYEKGDALDVRLVDAGYQAPVNYIFPIVIKRAYDPYYFGLRWAFDLKRNLNPLIFRHLPNSFFIVYDCAASILSVENNYEAIGRSLGYYENKIYLETQANLPQTDKCSAKPQIVSKDNPYLKVLDYQANKVSIESIYTEPKFILQLNHYDENWKAFVDGIPTTVFKAQGAFRGVYVPQGKHRVDFYYGSTIDYLFKYGMLAFFLNFFLGLVYSWSRKLSI